VPESGVGEPGSEVGARGPAAEQVVRIETGRVVRAQAQAVVVTVAGEIDGFTVDGLHAAVAAGLDQLGDAEILVIDLTEVTFLGSQGLQALFDVAQAVRRRGEPLRIVVDHNRLVIRRMQLTGLDDVLALFDTVDGALDFAS
jgi:anti-sigma B factor antagonist